MRGGGFDRYSFALKFPARYRILANHIRALNADHDRRSVRVPGCQLRHDGGIYHSKTLDPSNPEALIDNGHGGLAHLARSGSVLGGIAGLFHETEDFVVALNVRTGNLFGDDTT